MTFTSKCFSIRILLVISALLLPQLLRAGEIKLPTATVDGEFKVGSKVEHGRLEVENRDGMIVYSSNFGSVLPNGITFKSDDNAFMVPMLGKLDRKPGLHIWSMDLKTKSALKHAEIKLDSRGQCSTITGVFLFQMNGKDLVNDKWEFSYSCGQKVSQTVSVVSPATMKKLESSDSTQVAYSDLLLKTNSAPVAANNLELMSDFIAAKQSKLDACISALNKVTSSDKMAANSGSVQAILAIDSDYVVRSVEAKQSVFSTTEVEGCLLTEAKSWVVSSLKNAPLKAHINFELECSLDKKDNGIFLKDSLARRCTVVAKVWKVIASGGAS